VVDGGRVVGVLSQGDLIVEEARLHFPTIVNLFGVNVALPWHDRELDESVSKALGGQVREVMTAKPVTVRADATVEDAATLMHDKRVSRLPVVDSTGRLLGIVTRSDILRAMVAGLGEPYDAGEETPERLGEPAGTVDVRRPADDAAAARAGAEPEQDQDFGIDVGHV
jgi:CBS domain-containing protein